MTHEGRIYAALEPIARVGLDAELAARRSRLDGVETRRFKEKRLSSTQSSRSAPRMMPAMPSASTVSAITVIEGSSAYVRPSSAAIWLALAGAARDDPSPFTLSASNTCSGAAESEGAVVRDITSAEMGRRPMAFRRRCIQSERAVVHALKLRPTNIAQALPSSSIVH